MGMPCLKIISSKFAISVQILFTLYGESKITSTAEFSHKPTLNSEVKNRTN
jgi:hypothetical protein